MKKLKILLLGWIVVLSFTACYKSGGELIVTDDPPIVEIDTTVIEYATNFEIGGRAIPADTVFATASSTNVYSLDFTIADRPTVSFVWYIPNHIPSQPIEGNYQGDNVYVLNDTSISLVEAWLLDGMINNYPQIAIDFFIGGEIAISDVEVDIRRDTLQTGEIMVVDRAKVTLSGNLFDPIAGQSKVVSGSFTCNFSRPE